MTSFHKSNHRSFTLLELMMALAVMTLLSGGIFALIQSSLTGAAETRASQQRLEEWTGFIDLAHKTFRTFPSSATLEGTQPDLSGKILPRMIITDAPSAFSWGEEKYFSGETHLMTQIQVGGLIALGIYRRNPDHPDSQENPASTADPFWITLIKDLQQVRFRYYDLRNALWQEIWTEKNVRPGAVEISFLPAGETLWSTNLFWLPKVTRESGKEEKK